MFLSFKISFLYHASRNNLSELKIIEAPCPIPAMYVHLLLMSIFNNCAFKTGIKSFKGFSSSEIVLTGET